MQRIKMLMTFSCPFFVVYYKLYTKKLQYFQKVKPISGK